MDNQFTRRQVDSRIFRQNQGIGNSSHGFPNNTVTDPVREKAEMNAETMERREIQEMRSMISMLNFLVFSKWMRKQKRLGGSRLAHFQWTLLLVAVRLSFKSKRLTNHQRSTRFFLRQSKRLRGVFLRVGLVSGADHCNKLCKLGLEAQQTSLGRSTRARSQKKYQNLPKSDGHWVC